MPSQSAPRAVDHEDPEGAALGLLLSLTVMLGRDSDRALRRQGLTGAKAHLLFELQQRGPLTQRDLATALRVAPRTMTGLIDGLVASGHVTREPCPGDRRAHLITFTALGADTARGLDVGRFQLAHMLFDRMSAEQLACLTRGMAEVVERLAEQGLTPGYDDGDEA